MKKYKIEVLGKGCEISVFELSTEQKKQLKGVDEDMLNLDEICEKLNVDDILDSDERYIGANIGFDDYNIIVKDDNDNVVWESNPHLSTNPEWKREIEWIESVYHENNVLFVEESIKSYEGYLFNFTLETENEFNAELLIPIGTELSELFYIITSMRYDGNDLTDTKDYGDYSLKGSTYHLY